MGLCTRVSGRTTNPTVMEGQYLLQVLHTKETGRTGRRMGEVWSILRRGPSMRGAIFEDGKMARVSWSRRMAAPIEGIL